MKKIYSALFISAIFLIATFTISHYYSGLVFEGTFETKDVQYPTINTTALKERLSKLNNDDLEKMQESGLEVIKWRDILHKGRSNIVAEVLQNDQIFVKEHYPRGEVVDENSKSQYFYHSHRPSEHGHFHLFFYKKEIIDKHKPIATWKNVKPGAHLIDISMHPDGEPIGLFNTNQWVTSEYWYSADQTLDMLNHFAIDHAYPSWPVNQWLNHLLVLFKPQIEDILYERDQQITQMDKPIEQVLKDKKIEIFNSIPISIESQLDVISNILNERKCLSKDA